MENWFQFDGHHIDMSQTNIIRGTEKLGRRKHASSMRFDKSEAYFFCQCPQWQLVTWLKCRVRSVGASALAAANMAEKWSNSGMPGRISFEKQQPMSPTSILHLKLHACIYVPCESM